MVTVVGLVSPCRSGWRERLGVLHALLNEVTKHRHGASGFVALTDPPSGSNRRPRYISDAAPVPGHLFASTSASWLSLPRSSIVLAYTSPVPSDDGAAAATTTLRTLGDGSVLLHAGALPITKQDDPPALLNTLLGQTTGPITAAVLWANMDSIYVAQRGAPLCLARLLGDSGWFLCPSSDSFAKAVNRVYGPDSPLVEVAVPVADATVLALTTHGSACMITGSMPAQPCTP